MHIVSLTAENFKCLKAVHIAPDGALVQITGKNMQGKSSVLDSIWAAVGGVKAVPDEPIRTGEETARISLDLGDITVTRRFRKGEDGETTTTLVVANADGARFGSPQRVLDGLLGALTFDPLAFSRMKAGDQVEALKSLVPGIPFAEVEEANRLDYAKRTDVNRRAKDARTRAGAIVLTEGPTDLLDESAMVAELEAAGQANADLERQKAEREREGQAIHEAYAAIMRMKGEAAGIRARAAALVDRANAIDLQVEELEGAAKDREAMGANLPPLPDPVATANIKARIEEARVRNAGVTARQQTAAEHARLTEEANALEAQSKALTEAMEARTASLRAIIAAAQMPVPGLGIEGGAVTLNGLPLSQASGAERLRTSVAIAMAMNPKLRVIRVQDGSLLDAEGMKLLEEMAETNGFQCWVESVSNGERVGFTIEDGALVGEVA